MKVAIDASNIRSGGGLTHLKAIIDNVTLEDCNKIVIFSSRLTLDKLPEKDFVTKISHPYLNKSLFFMFLWQKYLSAKYIHKFKCDVLFVPGGTYIGKFRPFVTMSRNMLPFEFREIFRYKNLITRLRFITLHYSQKRSYNRSEGLIFLTNYAKEKILPFLKRSKVQTSTISHGVNNFFFSEPKEQKEIQLYSSAKPFNLLYVSPITAYKHQWNVVEAVYELKKKGFPIVLNLIGSADETYLNKIQNVINKNRRVPQIIKLLGTVKHPEISNFYKKADLFIYASSCENMPNILLEAMAAGLPIASSKMGPMPEILGEDAVYFDPLDPKDIELNIEKLILDKSLRNINAEKAYKRAQQFDWKNSTELTFKFIRKIIQSE